MRLWYVFVFATSLLLEAQLARADAVRCGSVLIQPGASVGYVLAKCGEPELKTTVTEPGTLYQAGLTYEVWRYKRGTVHFPANLKIANGVVQEITFEKNYQ